MTTGPTFSISDPGLFLNNGFNGYVSVFAGTYSEANLVSLFLSIPEVFAPINEIASRVISGEFYIKDLKTGERVTDDKYLNRLLTRPNPYGSFTDLVYSWIAYKYVTGNGYLYANVPETLKFKYENISTLFALPSHQTTIKLKDFRTSYYSVTAETDIIERYEVLEPNGYFKKIAPEMVHHQRFVDMGTTIRGYSSLKGVSPLLAAEKPMSNLVQVYEARNVIYLKRGALGMIVSRKSDESGNQALTKQEKEQLVADYHNTYGLTSGRSPIALTALPVDFVSIGMSIQDLQPFDETKADAAAIYGILQVPFDLAPKEEGSTFENTKQSEIRLYNNVVIGESEEFCNSFNQLLRLEASGLAMGVSFEHIDVLQEDAKRKSEVIASDTKTYRQQYIDGLITKNQYRLAVGQAPVDGEDFYIMDDPLLEIITRSYGNVTASQKG